MAEKRPDATSGAINAMAPSTPERKVGASPAGTPEPDRGLDQGHLTGRTGPHLYGQLRGAAAFAAAGARKKNGGSIGSARRSTSMPTLGKGSIERVFGIDDELEATEALHLYSTLVPGIFPSLAIMAELPSCFVPLSCQDLDPSTLVVAFDPTHPDPLAPQSMPIYQACAAINTATFVQPSVVQFGPYDYTRSGNPTRTAAETLVARLEGAYAAFAFTNGMSAVASLVRMLKASDEPGFFVTPVPFVFADKIQLLLASANSKLGITAQFADSAKRPDGGSGMVHCSSCDLALLSMITAKTAMVFVETPCNPTLRITDISELAEICQHHQALLVVDATVMTPILMKPLAHGADIVVHSAGKYFGGHGDCGGGFLCTGSADLAKRIAFLQNAEGTALCPFECWLVMRGIKTLALRIDRAQANAHCVAKWLLSHTKVVTKVYYPGLVPSPATPQVSFETASADLSARICKACKLFKIAQGYGSVNSGIEMPAFLSHASTRRRVFSDSLIRLSLGIESWQDIVYDLQLALQAACSPEADVVAERARLHSQSDPRKPYALPAAALDADESELGPPPTMLPADMPW
eukprot:gene11042-296_t